MKLVKMKLVRRGTRDGWFGTHIHIMMVSFLVFKWTGFNACLHICSLYYDMYMWFAAEMFISLCSAQISISTGVLIVLF